MQQIGGLSPETKAKVDTLQLLLQAEDDCPDKINKSVPGSKGTDDFKGMERTVCKQKKTV